MAASKLLYWIAGLCGVVAWTGGVMSFSSQPLLVELTLGGMGLVACAWGHSVLFPVARAVADPVAPGRLSRDAALEQAEHRLALAADPRATGAPRVAVGRPRRPAIVAAPLPPGELPALLRTPLEEAARMEARRLGEALTAAGLFGPVSVVIEADGTAFVAPVQEMAGVRLPAATVVQFAAYVTQPEGLAEEGRAGAGTWPGPHLAAAIAAHLNAALPARPPAARPAAPPLSVPPPLIAEATSGMARTV